MSGDTDRPAALSEDGDFRRFDLIFTSVKDTDDPKVVTITMRPDPRRYKEVEVDGRQYWEDTHDNVLYPRPDFLAAIASQFSERHLCFSLPQIRNAAEYVESRIPCINSALSQSSGDAPAHEPFPERHVPNIRPGTSHFVILSADIVGSTRLATTLSSDAYARLVRVCLREFAAVIWGFGGHVLKFTGDGLLAYFPEPNFTGNHDLAIDGAITLQRLATDAISPSLGRAGLPAIQIRVGIDSGRAVVEDLGLGCGTPSLDIIGAVANLAAKIQATAAPGEIRIGQSMLRGLHVQWREICEPVTPPQDWEYQDRQGEIYQLARVQWPPSAPPPTIVLGTTPTLAPTDISG
ncbi:MAG: adenylate/guanylate cyclase domain-containing protein [Phycisphaeraceae bacterium]|nr:adenylate/guanylate cyclase domain-containing protein [Phycisphaeraceae bacterium]